MKFKNQLVRIAFMMIVLISSISCSEDDKREVTRLPNAMEFLQANAAKYSILRDALIKTGLSTTLSSAGSYTLFAPSNDAFIAAGLTSASINALSTSVPADVITISNLRLILQNHVLTPGVREADLLAGGYFRTFAFYRTATTVTSGPQMSIFIRQVGTDVVINGGVANGGAIVTKSDIDVSNGIVYEVNSIIALPTIVSHIAANPTLSTLLSVVTSTGGTFGDQSAVRTVLTSATNVAPRTVIAPNNNAFTAATSGTGFLTGAAVTPANVTRVLQYHVLGTTGNRLNTFFTDNFVVFTSIPAPSQNFITFRVGASSFRIQDNAPAPNNVSRSVINDIQGVNGVVHIVDKVLQPTL